MTPKLNALHDAALEAHAELLRAKGDWLSFVMRSNDAAVALARATPGQPGSDLWMAYQRASETSSVANARFSDAHAQRPRPMRRAPRQALPA